MESNLKCLNSVHQENIEFYCETCNDIPMGKECIPLHKNHSINIYDLDKKDQLITDFSSSIKEYQKEVVFLKEELSRLQDQLDETQINSNNKINLIEVEFKKLHEILEIKRLNLRGQIETYQDENNQQFVIQKSKIENKIQMLNQSINKFLNSNTTDSLNQQQLLNLIKEKQYIEINKFNHQINEINKELPPFIEVIQPFNHVDLKINNNNNISGINDIPILFEDKQNQFQFIDFINNTFSIENKRKLKTTNNKNLIVLEKSELNKQINNYNCYILTSDDTKQPNYILLCFDNNFIKNNYNKKEILYQFDIIILHYQIKPNDNSEPFLNGFSICNYRYRIPNHNEIQKHYFNNSFENLIFQAGFKYIIPEGVEDLELVNTEQELEIGSIPSSVKFLDILDGFKQQLIKGIIPEGVQVLKLENIEQPLKIGSIPSSVKNLNIKDGFKHQLTKGIMPEGLDDLTLGNIEKPLEIGSIPSSVKYLYIQNGFKHQIIKGIIPEGVHTLIIGNIKHELVIGSIPSSVKHLLIQNGFKHQLTKCIIPEGVEELILNNIEQPLEIGSIPSSVRDLHIQDGFKHQLHDGIITEGVTSVSIRSTSIKLKDVSIPKSVRNIYINNNNNIIINSDIINNNFKNITQLYLTEKQYKTIDNNDILDKKLKFTIKKPSLYSSLFT